MAWPQVQVLVLPLGMVVAGDGVVVDTGEGVVVEAKINYSPSFYFIIHTPDSPVTSVVTVTVPETTAKNPFAVKTAFEWNLTVMLVPVTVPGLE